MTSAPRGRKSPGSPEHSQENASAVPRVARWIVERAVGRKTRPAVVGDLIEGYEGYHGRLGARSWFIRESMILWFRIKVENVRAAWGDDGEARKTMIGGIKELLSMGSMGRDARYAIRKMARSPGFTLVAIVSLALGIGANTAIFSVVNELLLSPQPFTDADELLEIYGGSDDFPYGALSNPTFRDLKDGTTDVFAAMSASRLSLIQTDTDAGVQLAPAEVVTGNYFTLSGIGAHVGRTLLPEDDVSPGAHPVVVLGYEYWESAYGADPGAVGQEIRLNGRSFSIIGVVSPEYKGHFRGLVPAVYASNMMVNDLVPAEVDQLEARTWQSYFGRARLKPGATLAQAEAALERVSLDIRVEHPTDWTVDRGFVAVPTADVIMHPSVDQVLAPAVGLLMGVVGLVLLIACANLASFLLARATDRRKEIAVRLAMGAGRVTLVRQLITETVILSLAGGLAGLGVAYGARTWLLNADLPLPLPLIMDLALDTRVLLFTLGVSLAVGLLFGLAPATQATNPAVASTLRDEGTGGGVRKRLTLRNALVVGQVAASLVLLVGAGLFVRSLQASQSVDPGFAYEPTAMMSIGLPTTRFSQEEGEAFAQTLMDRARQIRGVTEVGMITRLHLDPLNTTSTGINVEGFEPAPGQSAFGVDDTAVSPGTLSAMGIELVQGRDFDVTDTSDGQRVAIINQTMADQFWPDGDAVGRVFLEGDELEEVVVVGVARAAKVRSLGESPRPQIYWPLSQDYSAFLTMVAKTTADAQSVALQLFATAREIDPETMAFDYKTLERHLAVRLLPARLSVFLSGIFAALAMALACIGLYGVVSYSVAQKTREVGIRLSLGAEAGSVVRMLMKQGLGLVAVGGVVGLVGAALFARLLSSFLFGVDAMDPVAFTVVPLVLAGVALLAAYVPARRASRIDPVRALKAE